MILNSEFKGITDEGGSLSGYIKYVSQKREQRSWDELYDNLVQFFFVKREP